MKTPAGTDCRHYYQDFHRGRDIQECRLAKANPGSAPWRPRDCTGCPVPGILQANASADLVLTLTIKYRLLVLGRHNEVKAYCSRHSISVEDPYVGCSRCNAERPGIDVFLKALEEPEPDSNGE